MKYQKDKKAHRYDAALEYRILNPAPKLRSTTRRRSLKNCLGDLEELFDIIFIFYFAFLSFVFIFN
jgi:hypothetical protein